MKHVPISQHLRIKSFAELIQRAGELQLISARRKEGIQEEIQALVKKQVFKFNRNRSTCISAILLRKITASVFYALDHAVSTRSDSINLLNHTVEYLFDMGISELKERLSEVEKLAADLKRSCLNSLNERLNDVVFHQLPEFIKHYDLEFNALYCEFDLDYPLLDGLPLEHDMYHLSGVDLVLEYVHRLIIEQTFIEQFDKDELLAFVYDYETAKGIDVELLGVNFCEIVLVQLYFSWLLQQHSLLIKASDLNILKHKIGRSKCENSVDDFYGWLNKQIDQAQIEYLKCFKGQLKIRLQNADIENLVSVHRIKKKNQWFEPSLCSDAALNQLAEHLLHENSDKKIELLMQTALNCNDWIDLFEMDIFNETEFSDLFKRLDILPLCLLFYKAYPEEFLFNVIPSFTDSMLAELSYDHEWQKQLCIYLQHLEPSDREKLKMAAKQL